MVILEAMAQDNIVISFKGMWDQMLLLKMEKNGYLVEYENVSQLAKQIDLTTHNYHELEHIVQGGRKL